MLLRIGENSEMSSMIYAAHHRSEQRVSREDAACSHTAVSKMSRDLERADDTQLTQSNDVWRDASTDTVVVKYGRNCAPQKASILIPHVPNCYLAVDCRTR